MSFSRYTLIPDVHGRPFWRDAVRDMQDVPVIFLGDYLDPYPQDGVTWRDAWREFKDIVALKKAHPDRVTLLLGNHDVHYLPGYPFFERSSRYDDLHAVKIRRLFLDNIALFDLAAAVPREDGRPFLLTHAGVRKAWISEFWHTLHHESDSVRDFLIGLSDGEGSASRVAGLLNGALHSPDPELFKFLMRALSSIPRSRGGRGAGSCVWCDMGDMKRDEWDLLPDCIQIVGHTRQDTFSQFDFDLDGKTNVYCTDYGRAFTLEAGTSPFLRFKNELKTSFTYSDLSVCPEYFIFGLWLWNLSAEARTQAGDLVAKALAGGFLREFEPGAYYLWSSVMSFFREERNTNMPEWVIKNWRQMKPLVQDMRPEDLSAVILGKKMTDKYTRPKFA